ncbi:Uncharacterized protein TPAR_03796 [Tolypocladium paradoxum]|uniref:HNH nuclease domain-containing protein n=1 Tax=Tolypocladium paradoxum TaxID=94208 RepID=A0A2S4L0K7_9HYPO|nr:Uncharacterized protein TPAR_03796 [Tolypocladium paradoxum]
MVPASALHRHQSSFEGIIDFSTQPPLGPGQRLSASRRFYQIVNHFDFSGSSSNGEYDRIKLVRLSYEYARSEESKGNFLQTRSIDPPSPRLLAIHSAIAHILHLSAAGDYIDKMLQDMEENGVLEDGSTELNRLVKLRLNGWSVSG